MEINKDELNKFLNNFGRVLFLTAYEMKGTEHYNSLCVMLKNVGMT